MSTNTTSRLASVIMSDAHHVLQLIEIRTHMRWNGADTYRVDRAEVEALARERLRESGRNPDDYDYVGTLVAHPDIPSCRGRITYAEEVETQREVTL